MFKGIKYTDKHVINRGKGVLYLAGFNNSSYVFKFIIALPELILYSLGVKFLPGNLKPRPIII